MVEGGGGGGLVILNSYFVSKTDGFVCKMMDSISLEINEFYI